MRELAVYYCSYCGYYAYYQSSNNTRCPRCNMMMNKLKTKYRDFIELNYQERDELLSGEILEQYPDIMERIFAAQGQFTQREIIAQLAKRLDELETENKKMDETITWMHQTIWELLRKNKEKRENENGEAE